MHVIIRVCHTRTVLIKISAISPSCLFIFHTARFDLQSVRQSMFFLLLCYDITVCRFIGTLIIYFNVIVQVKFNRILNT